MFVASSNRYPISPLSHSQEFTMKASLLGITLAFGLASGIAAAQAADMSSMQQQAAAQPATTTSMMATEQELVPGLQGQYQSDLRRADHRQLLRPGRPICRYARLSAGRLEGNRQSAVLIEVSLQSERRRQSAPPFCFSLRACNCRVPADRSSRRGTDASRARVLARDRGTASGRSSRRGNPRMRPNPYR